MPDATRTVSAADPCADPVFAVPQPRLPATRLMSAGADEGRGADVINECCEGCTTEEYSAGCC
jgi:hypothetical protein